ncbi:hypothetical protein IL60_0200235 [Brucella inopinata BO1]|nr:hypothetical protein IL60_0200235 [Brucella inopinata BO1]
MLQVPVPANATPLCIKAPKNCGGVSICVGRKYQNNLPFVYAFSILGEALSFFCNEMQKKRVTFVGVILYIAAHYMYSYIS